MSLELFDHAVVFVLAVAAPIWAVRGFRRFKQVKLRGDLDGLLKDYRRTMIVQWSTVLVFAALWFVAGRDFAALGLRLPTGLGWWIGIGLTLAALAGLIAHTRASLANPEKRQKILAEVEPVADMMPRSDRDFRAFVALSFTAGVCEEVLYRGFLLYYFTPLVGTWGAIAVAAAIFGLGHIYQGVMPALKIVVVGLVMCGLYVLTGSLWAPMLAHFIGDWIGGYTGRQALELAPPVTQPTAA